MEKIFTLIIGHSKHEDKSGHQHSVAEVKELKKYLENGWEIKSVHLENSSIGNRTSSGIVILQNLSKQISVQSKPKPPVAEKKNKSK